MRYEDNRKFALEKALDIYWPSSDEKQVTAENVVETASKFLRFIEGGEKGEDTEKA